MKIELKDEQAGRRMQAGNDSSKSTSHATDRMAKKTWFHSVARVGIASRGVIYLLLAYLAFDIARNGNAPTPTSSTGALQAVKDRSGGASLMAVLAIGLGCYGLWRLLDALTQEQNWAKRLGLFSIAVLYFGLCVQAVKLMTGTTPSNGPENNPVPLVGRVLAWSGGPAIMEVTGVVLLGAGVIFAIWGVAHGLEKDLAMEQIHRRTRGLVKITRAAGDVTRGFLVVLVGVYLTKAGISANPSQAKSVDESLKTLVQHSYGAVVIGLVAVGLLCFAIFSGFDARLRRV